MAHGKVLSVAEEGASSGACPPLREGSERSGCLLSQDMQIFLVSRSAAPNPARLWEPKAGFGLGCRTWVRRENAGGTEPAPS